jgi:hypothetical protein
LAIPCPAADSLTLPAEARKEEAIIKPAAESVAACRNCLRPGSNKESLDSLSARAHHCSDETPAVCVPVHKQKAADCQETNATTMSPDCKRTVQAVFCP